MGTHAFFMLSPYGEISLCCLPVRAFAKLCMSDFPSVVEIFQNCLPDHPRYRCLTTSGIEVIYLRFDFEKWVSRIGQRIRRGSLRFLFSDVRDRATFVAEESNKLVGVAEVYPTTNDEWLIDAIAVLPNYHKRGIGSQLVKKLMSHIINKGGKKIQLYVQSHNVSAIRSYTKLGFTIAPPAHSYDNGS